MHIPCVSLIDDLSLNLALKYFLRSAIFVTRLMSLKEDEKALCVQFILISQESRL